jgi:hypothetical protein
MPLRSSSRRHSSLQSVLPSLPCGNAFHRNGPRSVQPKCISTARALPVSPQYFRSHSHILILIFIAFRALSPTPSTFSMNTRRKNKSAHPGAPDMTPSQRASAGLPRARCPPKKKPTKEQQRLVALENELHATREQLLKATSVTDSNLFEVCTSLLTSINFFRTVPRLVWVVTLTLELTPRRPLPLAQNARPQGWLTQPQSVSRFFCILPLC